jgi:hypothetical protein
MRAWCGAAALAASILIIDASSPAQTSSGDAVDVVIAADDASALAMRAVVIELIARLGLATNVTLATDVNAAELITPRAGAEPRTARVWIDLSKPERATLYLVDRGWERILIRHVRKLPGHEELSREAIGHILETAVDALAHGAQIGVAREEARLQIEEASAPVDVPPLPAPSQGAPGPRLELGAMYEAELYAQGGVVANGPAASFYIGKPRGAVRPGGWLTLQYRLPMIVDTAPLGVRLDGGTGRALAAIDLAVGPRLAVRLGLGGGIDVLHMSPRLERSPGTTRGKDDDFVVLVARASGAASLSLSADLALTVVVSCDLDPSGTRYVVAVDGVTAPALSPWPVRPALSLGLTFQHFL